MFGDVTYLIVGVVMAGALVLLIIGGVVAYLIASLKRKKRDVEALVRERLGGHVERIDASANSFGVESGGMAQVRGNGCLGWNGRELLFVMWAPKREVHVPKGRILGVETTKSHLGKSKGVELLKVRFTNDAGVEDSVAWMVRDVSGWVAALRS